MMEVQRKEKDQHHMKQQIFQVNVRQELLKRGLTSPQIASFTKRVRIACNLGYSVEQVVRSVMKTCLEDKEVKRKRQYNLANGCLVDKEWDS